MADQPQPQPQPALPSPDRRKALALGAAAAAAAWVAPAVLSVDAVAAQSQIQPPPGSGILSGSALICGRLPDPGEDARITFTPQGGGLPTVVNGTPFGDYTAILPAGTYDASVVPGDRPSFSPSVYTGLVVTDGGTTIANLDYTAEC